MRHGPVWHEDGTVTFHLWAPSVDAVTLKLNNAPMAMRQGKGGWFDHTISAAPGMRYQFMIGDQAVPDPASRFQSEGVNGPSELMRDGYEWKTKDWHGRAWEEAVIYEIHVGSFSVRGDFAGVEAKLDYLRDLGITAIELMPIAAFDGNRGWGYDGVLPYAPHAPYGRPETLKRLVDAAHARGLMVLLDVVYNHFGPSGNYLSSYAAPFFTDRHQTPWGAAIDFTQRPVREFFVQNALYWLREFRLDGLRFDAVHAIIDDSPTSILKEIATRARAEITDRPVHLILENDKNEAAHLRDYNAQWNDDAHHVFHVLATNEIGGYYNDYAEQPVTRLGRCLTQGFDYQGQPSAHRHGEQRGQPSGHLSPTAFVNFLQNHDQIGNRALGERLTALVDEKRLAMLRAILLLSPAIPLLFMGEEWGSKTSFLYFCDFTGELAHAVREGRRKEFASFPQFNDQKKQEAIPDPNAPESFHASQLDWDACRIAAHQAIQAQVRQCLALRHKHIMPLLKQGMVDAAFDSVGENAIDIRWRFPQQQLQMMANFGDTPVAELKPIAGTLLWGSTEPVLPGASLVFTVGPNHG